MCPPPYVASLRIYEPIDSFEASYTFKWSQYSDQKFQSEANNKFALGWCLLSPKNK